MIGFGVTSKDRDLYLNDSGDLVTVSGAECMSQAITSSLLLWNGEYDFDINIGLPYNTILGNPHINYDLLYYQISNAIMLPNQYLTPNQLSLYGINQIIDLNFTIDQKSRKLIINTTISLNNGEQISLQV